MSFKITHKEEFQKYDASGHYNCLTTRLHDSGDIDKGELVIGLNHYLPGGGCEMVPAEYETIYYIQKGKMTFTMDDENKFVLYPGDSIHLGVSTGCAICNMTSAPAEMVTMMIKPLAD